MLHHLLQAPISGHLPPNGTVCKGFTRCALLVITTTTKLMQLSMKCNCLGKKNAFFSFQECMLDLCAEDFVM